MIEEKRITIPSLKIGDIEVEDIETNVFIEFEPSWKNHFDYSESEIKRTDAELIDFNFETELTDEQLEELQEKINEYMEDLC